MKYFLENAACKIGGAINSSFRLQTKAFASASALFAYYFQKHTACVHFGLLHFATHSPFASTAFQSH